ncbi:MAG: universal stress protein [Gammaproteobacteria bacterium]|nr:universal stress protein [Gammaproteobacteria bacterium]
MESQQLTPRILLTTDFSAESEIAFFHALAIALKRKARLTLLHTGGESREQVPWSRFPSVRGTLQTWGLLGTDAARTDVIDKLGIDINKMAQRDYDPRNGITDYLRRSPTDLLVMASQGRTGLARFRNTSIAETVSYRTKSHTLMLPKDGSQFVDPATGTSSLRCVLCALDMKHDPRTLLTFLSRWLPDMAADGEVVDVFVLQVGEPEEPQQLMVPQAERLRWQGMVSHDELVDAVMQAAESIEPDMVVVQADSPSNLRGRLRGSRIDRIMHTLRVPVLSMPVFGD